MAYALGGLFALVLFYLAARWFVRADAVRVAATLKVVAIVLALAGIALLAFVGRIGLVVMAASILLPLYLRWRNARRAGGLRGPAAGRPRPTAGQRSSLDTEFFSMTLDHESGALDGEVRKGRERGRRLSALDLAALLALLDECRDDPPSLQVLTAYLDRHHADWRETAGAAGRAGEPGGGEGPALSRDEAFRILGLEPGADEAAIREAHRRLMLQFHPDRGGSAWFAARINEARDLLIGR
jgi:hypothetical protein